jgi:glycogen debranching enzyme
MARSSGDDDFTKQWKYLPEKIETAFINAYWSDERAYLADVYNGFYTDWSVRPNMVIAAAMDYTPLDKHQQHSILELATRDLLTPRGLRTLSPHDPQYRGVVEGTPDQRESAVHNGAAHPWLLQMYVQAYLRLHKKSGLSHIKAIVEGFKDEMTQNCLGTISELYNGNPPHEGKGALSQAWNVAAIIYSLNLIEQTEKA